ncbi:MAG TPA: TIGR03435 family protein [Bryobacteraceae bacterium]|nr:TIGR03435 family protein [Bryobacteraceae bacterium]
MPRRCLVLLIAAAGFLTGQPPAKPKFDVVSIKENSDNGGPPIWTPQRSGNRVRLRKVRPEIIIDYAWHIDSLWQVSFPDNMPLDWLDVEAEAPGNPDEDTLRLMFQSMLEDRFKVKAHYEQREIEQWDLVVSKPGKLRPTNPESTMTLSGRPVPRGTAAIAREADGRHLISSACSIAQIADSFSRILHAPVANQTNLAGVYEYNILLDEDPPNLPSVVYRELGLKLIRSKGQARVLVVERVEKPTPN